MVDARRVVDGALRVSGTVTEVSPGRVVVEGISGVPGSFVEVDGHRLEVVAASPGRAVCVPVDPTRLPAPGDRVRPDRWAGHCPAGDGLVGRVIDGWGRPIDRAGPLRGVVEVPVDNTPPAAVDRPPVNRRLWVGVRAVDAFVPLGEGQRIGVFAGSGVGKTTLLHQMMSGASADVVVAALVGERGRELGLLVERFSGQDRTTVVVTTSDRPALERRRAAAVAMRVAEWWRDQGLSVLVVLDSLTRFAHAHREIAMVAGEPPVARGYPPSLVPRMAGLLERAGTSPAGSITLVSTVLVEGEDFDDPVADTARSILDGHIVLRRELAASGRWPAVDPLRSVSRVADAVRDPDEADDARVVLGALARIEESADLVATGLWRPGGDPVLDRALAARDAIEEFLRQGPDEPVTPERTRRGLALLAGALR